MCWPTMRFKLPTYIPISQGYSRFSRTIFFLFSFTSNQAVLFLLLEIFTIILLLFFSEKKALQNVETHASCIQKRIFEGII